MTEAADQHAGVWQRLARFMPVVVLATAVGIFGLALWHRTSQAAPKAEVESTVEPVAIDASGPRFDSVETMTEASDFVLVGSVAEVADGRALTDPSDPTAGIRTQLVSFNIDTVVKAPSTEGPVGERHVIEQEAELLDGTPVIVNGLSPFEVGDRGVVFLIQGDGEAFPHAALINEQGWVRLDDGMVVADDGDRLWRAYVGFTVEELLGAIAP